MFSLAEVTNQAAILLSLQNFEMVSVAMWMPWISHLLASRTTGTGEPSGSVTFSLRSLNHCTTNRFEKWHTSPITHWSLSILFAFGLLNKADRYTDFIGSTEWVTVNDDFMQNGEKVVNTLKHNLKLYRKTSGQTVLGWSFDHRTNQI